MTPVLIFVVASAVGIEVGWEPLDTGGHEYTIQLEPQLLDMLRQGYDVVSKVPPQLEVRQYRITTGTGKLTRIDGPPRPEPAPAMPESEPPQTAPEQSPPPPDPFPPAGRHEGRHDSADAGPPLEAPHVAEGSGTGDAAAHAPQIPGKLPPDGEASQPLAGKAVGFDEPENGHIAKKEEVNAPSAKSGAGHGDSVEPGRPWMPFLIASGMLCCSLAANVYLGWIAWDARSRFRDAVAKFRASPAA